MLAPLVEVGVREFEEIGHDIAGRDAFRGQVAVRIEFRCDHHFRPHDGADTLQQIAFAIVIALRDHGAVQAEDHRIDRQCGLELIEYLVAQRLIGLPLNQPAGLRPSRGAFDDGQPFPVRALA